MKVRNFERFYLKTLRCKARVVPALYGYCVVGHFIAAENAHAPDINIFDHVVESSHFVSRSARRRLQFYEWISLPPSKVCPQCETNYCTTKDESVLLV